MKKKKRYIRVTLVALEEERLGMIFCYAISNASEDTVTPFFLARYSACDGDDMYYASHSASCYDIISLLVEEDSAF